MNYQRKLQVKEDRSREIEEEVARLRAAAPPDAACAPKVKASKPKPVLEPPAPVLSELETMQVDLSRKKADKEAAKREVFRKQVIPL
jgi:hypothetical protein